MPLVAVQGRRVRATLDPAPPAAGPTTGVVGDEAVEPLRLCVVGDSTAAGHGVDTHADGFAGCLARTLVEQTGRSVHWTAVGRLGATSRRIRYRLLPRLDARLDLAVLLAGVNDVLGGRSPKQWGEDLAAIVDDLTERAAHVAVSGLPPFAEFPVLPKTLARYLGERAQAFDEVSARVCADRNATLLDSRWVGPGTVTADFFASDRFHPSALGYRRWGEFAAAQLPPF